MYHPPVPTPERDRTVFALEKQHVGETVFIIGAGPQLLFLTQPQMQQLSGSTAIGLNMVPYRIPTKYFLSSYVAMGVFAECEYERREYKALLLHLCCSKGMRSFGNLTPIGKRQYQGFLERDFRGGSHVRTSKNVALAATHLAHIMGANRIVYVGVEQNDWRHFYQYLPDVHLRAVADVEKTLRSGTDLAKHLTRRWQDYRDRYLKQFALRNGNEPPRRNWGRDGIFAEYITTLQERGVDVIATMWDSTPRRAGARYVPLVKILHEERQTCALPA